MIQWHVLILTACIGIGVVDSQGYQWQCSALDTADNRYYLPDLQDGNSLTILLIALTASAYTPSSVGVTYIYTVPSIEVSCSGTVSAIGYCYTGSSEQLETEQLVFTFLTLKQNGLNFTVTDSIEVRARPRSQICSQLRGTLYCCDATSLNMTDHFILPASNFAFGIAIPPSSVRLLGFNNPSLQVAHYQEAQTVIPSVGSTFSVGNLVTQGLRLLRFHISKFKINYN